VCVPCLTTTIMKVLFGLSIFAISASLFAKAFFVVPNNEASCATLDKRTVITRQSELFCGGAAHEYAARRRVDADSRISHLELCVSAQPAFSPQGIFTLRAWSSGRNSETKFVNGIPTSLLILSEAIHPGSLPKTSATAAAHDLALDSVLDQ